MFLPINATTTGEVDILIHGAAVIKRLFMELNDLSRPFQHWTAQINNNLSMRINCF